MFRLCMFMQCTLIVSLHDSCCMGTRPYNKYMGEYYTYVKQYRRQRNEPRIFSVAQLTVLYAKQILLYTFFYLFELFNEFYEQDNKNINCFSDFVYTPHSVVADSPLGGSWKQIMICICVVEKKLTCMVPGATETQYIWEHQP